MWIGYGGALPLVAWLSQVSTNIDTVHQQVGLLKEETRDDLGELGKGLREIQASLSILNNARATDTTAAAE